jgi:hypothetical protein
LRPDSARPGGPTAKGQPSPEGLGIHHDDDERRRRGTFLLDDAMHEPGARSDVFIEKP